MSWIWRLLVLVLVFSACIFLACSKENSSENKTSGIETTTRQAKEAIQDYGRRPIDKARKAQAMGEDRTKAMDDVIENLDRR